MTFLFPGWVQIVFHVSVYLTVISLFGFFSNFISKRVEKKVYERLFIILLAIATFATLLFIHKSYKTFSVYSSDLVVQSDGEVIEVEEDEWLWTTDDDLFVFINYDMFEMQEYRVGTQDNKTVKFNLRISSQEFDVKTVQNMSVKFAEAIAEDRSDDLPLFLSYSSYHEEVMKEKWQESLKAEVGKYSKNELTDEKLRVIVNKVFMSVFDEYEQKVFVVEVIE
ncbi:hypothetical protein AB685_03545 [Bacillus sp. LL01]|uniref:hypothetical protein n=1 Tax=Bacillus sp. LL01 TaxID=1665556 RepID=UPI00064D0DE5|nr:hypothetical protein [Bacillus sp. LL01]KMJ59935.1 hypothetical protein AB685_03545 [Bacillus sp. LL01]